MENPKKRKGLLLWTVGSSGGRMVKLLACGARGLGFDSRPPLEFSEIGYLLLPSRDMAERSLN